MEVKLVHLYPDVMSLYGEYANIAVLGRTLEGLGAAVTVEKVGYGDSADFAFADFIYMGAGTERTQKYALEKLAARADDLKAAVDRGVPALFTGNAMELLGKSVTDAGGRAWPCLGLADYATVETDKRDPVDVIAHSPLLERPAVGFMNKCSTTSGVTAPLFDRLSLGFGNEAKGGPEGYVDGNLFATHLTGPVLVKNPELLALMIRRIFAYKGWEAPEAVPALPHQAEAYEVTLSELSARAKG